MASEEVAEEAHYTEAQRCTFCIDAADHKSINNDDSHQSLYGLEYSFEVSQYPQEPV